MTPEDAHDEAVAAARKWRKDLRAGRTEDRTPPAGYRLEWLDCGSGPGVEILVPDSRLAP